MNKAVKTALCTLALAAVAGAGVLCAQEVPTWDGETTTPTGNISFDQLGDIAISAQAFVFDSTGTLFAGGTGDFYRYDPEHGSWIEVLGNYTPSHLLALNPDTLICDDGHLDRSTDGGKSWEEIHELSSNALYQTQSGLLISGMRSDEPGIAYSTDRSDTWHVASFPDLESEPNHRGEDFLAFPPGHPLEGRLLSGGSYGLAYSDDDGQTWTPSNIWQQFRYFGYSFALTAGGRALATANDNANPVGGIQLYGSDDGGQTWELLGNFLDPKDGLPGNMLLVGDNYGYALEDGSLFVVTGRGRVWRSRDDGESWVLEAIVTDLDDIESIDDGTIVGPDNRMYIGVKRAGPEEAYAFRSTGEVVVANEQQPELPESESSLRVYPNPSSDTLSIEADPVEDTAIVYDLRGREVLRVALTSGRTTIDTGSLPAGVYVVAVGGDSRRVTIAR